MLGNTGVKQPKFSAVTLNERYVALMLSVFFAALSILTMSGMLNSSVAPRYALLVLSSLVVSIFIVWQRALRWHVLFVVPLVLVLWSMLSLNWSGDVAEGGFQAIQLMHAVLLGWCCYQLTLLQSVRWLLLAAVAGLGFSALVGIGQNFGFNPLGFTQLAPPAGTFANKNMAAAATLIGLPVIFVLLLLEDQFLRRCLLATGFSLLLSYLLISHTKGAWVGAVIGGIVFVRLLFESNSLRQKFIAGMKLNRWLISSAVLLAILLFVLPSEVFNAGRSVPIEGRSYIRLEMYADAIPMLTDHPVAGVGVGGYRIAYQDYMRGEQVLKKAQNGAYPRFLHSDILQNFVELGVVGGILFLLVVVGAALIVVKAVRSEADYRLRLLILGLGIGVFALLVHSLFSFPLRTAVTQSFFWGWLGLIAALAGQARGKAVKLIELRLSRIAQVCLVAILTLYLVVIAYGYQQKLSAFKYAHITTGRVAADCSEILQNVHKAYETFPFSYSVRAYGLNAMAACGAPNEEQLAYATQVLTHEPNNEQALLLGARVLMGEGRLDEAKTYFEKINEKLPQSAEAFYGLAYIARSQGEWQRAVELFEVLVSIYPADSELVLELTRAKEKLSIEKVN